MILNIPFPGASFRIPGIATIGPQLTVEGSLDASLSVAGTIETKIEIADWEVRQVVPDNNDNDYKPKLLDDPSLARTGDFNGIQRPEFYAGVEVQGDMSASLSVAAEFGVRFDRRWDVDPAAAAVVGEASVSAKLGAGKSTTGSCPFTFGVDVGARLYARAEAPSMFKWPGAEYDITPQWKKEIIAGGTCPNLGNIPSKRDLATLDAGWNDSTSLYIPDSKELRGRGLLQKRGGVYGPAFSIPIGNFFCPPSNDPNENEGSPCTVDAAWDNDKYLTNDDDYLKRRTLDLEDAIILDWVENGTAIFDEHLLEKRATKSSRLCDLPISINYPSGGDIPQAHAYGFENPDVCGDYEFGLPLDARVSGGPQYDSEHVLEFQLPGQFFANLDNTLGTFPHPDPADPSRVSFCRLINLQWGGHSVAIPGLDTARGNGATLTPAVHVAAQFPTNNWHLDEYVVLEHQINTPAKGKAWGTERRIINTDRWETEMLPTRNGARRMLKSMRYLVGQRMYQNDVGIQSIMNQQVSRVQNVLNQLDSNILPNNPANQNWRPWTPMGLGQQWQTFMRSKYAEMQAKTMRPINEFLPKLIQQHASEAIEQAAQDAPGDTPAQQAEKQEIRNLIDDINALNDVLKTLPAWNRPF